MISRKSKVGLPSFRQPTFTDIRWIDDSVSGEGLPIPFGRGSAGQYWLYPLDSQGSTNIVVETPPEKRISLSGKTVALRSNATIDVSRQGGSMRLNSPKDWAVPAVCLIQARQGTSVSSPSCPACTTSSPPNDPLEFSLSGLKTGDSVYLGGIQGLSVGQYTLTPRPLRAAAGRVSGDTQARRGRAGTRPDPPGCCGTTHRRRPLRGRKDQHCLSALARVCRGTRCHRPYPLRIQGLLREPVFCQQGPT